MSTQHFIEDKNTLQPYKCYRCDSLSMNKHKYWLHLVQTHEFGDYNSFTAYQVVSEQSPLDHEEIVDLYYRNSHDNYILKKYKNLIGLD